MSQENNQTANVINNFCNTLKNSVYTKLADLSVEAWITPEPVPYSEKTSGAYKKLEIGDSWGKLWDCGWMHVTGKVPEAAKGEKVVLLVDVSGEGCVFDEEGNPVKGITTYASQFDTTLGMPVKRVIQFTENSSGCEDVELWIETGCNDLFGRVVDNGCLKQAEISICHEECRQLYYDFKFLSLLCEAIPKDEPFIRQVRRCLYETALGCDLKDLGSVTAAISRLAGFLKMPNSDTSLTFSAVGHAHIDLAWLWPIRETKRKGARTFSTVLELMERYPDYVFGASQPQLYQWMKDEYPGLYERIRLQVQDGRWECQGAMWVEPDTNISGGESLVRQLVYGKKFFREEFGKEMRILWLPDVFGYSGALPQLLRKSDVPYFMTIKLSWNEHNVFPYNTFLWKGIDDSEVLVHMPPENTYNSGAMPGSIKKAEENFKEKDVSSEALLLFGIGDGGGGPSTDHLEYLKREKNFVALPPVTQQPAIEFFDRIAEDRTQYPKWHGELYLEKHQGTYTTQAHNKKNNRKIEFALRDCEYLCTLARMKTGFVYPQQELEEIWKEVLLYQFHDILPGSSIMRVYNETEERYRVLFDRVREITAEACASLAVFMAASADETIVFNTLPWARTDFVKTAGGDEKVTVAPFGWKTISAKAAAPAVEKTVTESDGQYTLENDQIKVIFDADGTICSIYDKTVLREILNKDHAVNNLAIYDDSGDCWDIPINYSDEKPQKLSVKSCEKTEGANHDGLRFTYSYGNSEIVQEIHINGKRLVFDCSAEWRETHKMLRALYPVDLVTEEAACNIQFGYIKRPTHRNTSWDYAKFEICAQKWIDLSENGYGVALVNDCKYGYSVWNNVLNINLLRSPMYPGVDADKGSHTFSYELFLHDGDLLKVQEEGYRFNTALLAVKGGENTGRAEKAEGSFLQVSEPNIVTEAVKMSEDGTGYILRLYECCGKETDAAIHTEGMQKATLVNLIERELEELHVNEETVKLRFRPFEIHTVKIPF